MLGDNLLQFCLTTLKYIGYNPLEKIMGFALIMKSSHLISASILLILAILIPILNPDTFSIEKLCKTLETLVTISQGYLKVYILHTFRDDIKDLLLKMKMNFWTVENTDENLYNEAKNIFRQYRNVARLFIAAICGVLITFTYHVLIARELFMESYVPNKFLLTSNVILGLQYCYVVGSVLIVCGFDVLYMAMCAMITVQLKIIRYKIENIMKIQDKDAMIVTCVEHHVFISKFLHKLIEIYTPFFLVQYFTSLFSIGVQMFQLTEGVADIQMFIKSIMYMFAIMIQFGGCYCIPSQNIYDETFSISQAAYMDCEGNLRLTRKLIFILMVSQRQFGFSAGIMGSINIATITRMFRASMSMFAFFKSLKDK